MKDIKSKYLSEVQSAHYLLPNLGTCSIDYRERVLVGLRLSPAGDCPFEGERTAFSDELFSQVEQYLSGERKDFNVEIDLSERSSFEQEVYAQLLAVPYAELRSYRQIAQAIGRPKASRAVGGACNRNPIHLIVPCHRVVSAKGELTGYAAGLKIKRYLIDLEISKE